MTCPHCGTDTPAGAARCLSCGAPQGAPGDRTPAPRDLEATVGFRDSDATAGLPGAGAFETIGTGTPAAGSGAHHVDIDVTRTPGVAIGPTAGSRGGSSAGAAQPFTMLTAGQTLGVRYHIIRLLGAGGMGAVYHAWDAELGVAVALKVIRGDITGDPDATAAIERQFKRELLLARQVTHKHVVRIHDLNEIDGIKYITMPYVQGSDLSTLLKESGTLPIPRALRYVSQVVGGLVAAHEAGVVHRDLKPANIMIDEDDQALIMDFGIAHSSSAGGSNAGQVVGTLAYMAPEQAQAKPTDQRADVYALGMMLREMLVGKKPSEGGQQALADLMQRIKEAPPPLRTIDETIPEPLEALAAKCVEPDPDKRFQSSAELAAALAALDENGQLRPVVTPGLSPWRLAAAAAAIVVAIGVATTVIISRRPVKPIDPVSILVADFDNRTNDSVFTGSLENALGIAMEGASFISAYDRVAAQRLATQLKLGATLDEPTARLLSRREGIKVILAGTIVNKGAGYTVSVKAIDPTDDKVLTTETSSASSKADALRVVGRLAAGVRGTLGDTSSRAEKLASADTFTAASLEAVRSYSLAQDLAAAGKYEDAIGQYRRAIEQDPNFGRAHSGWATSAFRLGRRDEAAEQWKKAISFMDRMSEREKYRTLGSYFLGIARDYDQAIDNYERLVKLYPADRIGHNNLAFAYFQKLNFPKALEEGRRAIEIYRGNVTAWNNNVLYAMYASDFSAAATEAERVSKTYPDFPKAYLPQAMGALDAGKRDAARSAYDRMARTGGLGTSLATMGLADLAMYEGQFPDAERILTDGVAGDERAKNTEGRASKTLALGEIYEAQGKGALAVDAAQRALKLGPGDAVVVPAARILLRQGKAAAARELAAQLGQQLQPRNRAYAKIIEAEIALRERRWVDAVEALRNAQRLADVWLGRFDLGVAYVEAGQYTQGLAELEQCVKRRGEATAIFLDDIPSYRYLAPLGYWLGRAKDELGMKAAAAEHYKAFLALRPNSPKEPLAVDAQRRVSSQ